MTNKNLKRDYRTQQINIKKGHRLHSYFNELCFQSNNLYNASNFYIRQVYTALHSGKKLQPLQQEVMNTLKNNMEKMNELQINSHHKRLAKEKLKPMAEQKEWKPTLFELPSKDKSFLGYHFLDCLFKVIKQPDYYSLPGQMNQQVIRNVIQNWKNFFKSLKTHKTNPEKFKGAPSIPGYLPKGGRKEAILSNQICKIQDGKYLRFPKTKIRLNIGKLALQNAAFQQVRIIPKYDGFTVEVIYLVGFKKEVPAKKERCMSMDLGIDNIAAIAFNTKNAPVLFKGGVIKSTNQWYNKMRAFHYAALRNGQKPKEGPFHSKKLSILNAKRHRKMKDFFHKVSFHILKIAVENNVDTIIIGKNKDWKQNSNMGKRNNQHFVQIPHALFIELITY